VTVETLAKVVEIGFKKLGLNYDSIVRQANDEYDGEFPNGWIGNVTTTEGRISKAEDNIRKYGQGLAIGHGDQPIENLWNFRFNRFVYDNKNNDEAIIAKYRELNPYPSYNDPTSTLIPREIIPDGAIV
jgi:hypothetical protein